MPKAKKAEAPAIQEVDPDFIFEDEAPNFEEDEENFNAKDLEDIAAVAEEIIALARNSVAEGEATLASAKAAKEEPAAEYVTENSFVQFTKEVINSLKNLKDDVHELRASMENFRRHFVSDLNKLDSLLIREDPTRNIYLLADTLALVNTNLAEINTKMESLASSAPKTPPVNHAPSTVMTMGTTTPSVAINTDQVRTWLKKIPSGKGLNLAQVAAKIAAHMTPSADPKQVTNVIVDSADIVKVVDGLVYLL
jgi:hypothetical protein